MAKAFTGDKCEGDKFVVYEKMTHSTSLWHSKKLDSIKQWVATEKIHGANFSFTVDDEKRSGSPVVKIARRNGFLNKESFFGINNQEGFIEDESKKAIHLYHAVQERSIFGNIVSVTIYGELFGGHYPHPSMEKCTNISAVQREVLYCPDLKFMAFDISITNRDTLCRSYIDYDVSIDLFKSSGYLYAEPLVIGTLRDMINFPLGFDTTIPAKLGLPPLQHQAENIAEGIVVKPIKNTVIESTEGMKRIIFKRKVEGFTERKPRTKEFTVSKEKKSLAYKDQEDYQLIKYEMLALTTEQRVVNVISKLGQPDEEVTEFTVPTWDDIHGALIVDIVNEIKTDRELWTKFNDMQKKLKALLMTEIKKECTQIIEEHKRQSQY